MNDHHFVKRARLRLASLGALTLFVGAGLLGLLAIGAGQPLRGVLLALALCCLAAMTFALFEAARLARELEQENLDQIYPRPAATDWETTKEDLRALHARQGRN